MASNDRQNTPQRDAPIVIRPEDIASLAPSHPEKRKQDNSGKVLAIVGGLFLTALLAMGDQIVPAVVVLVITVFVGLVMARSTPTNAQPTLPARSIPTPPPSPPLLRPQDSELQAQELGSLIKVGESLAVATDPNLINLEVRLVSDEPLCPLCGEPLAGETLYSCPGCMTPHHRECWQTNRGCTTFGCGRRA
jgi:hypothetical protein